MKQFLKSIARPFVVKLARRLYEIGERAVEQNLPTFANQPHNLRIELPRRLAASQYMHIGDHVNLGPGSLLVAQTYYPSEPMQHPENPRSLQYFSPKLVIGHRVTSTGSLTITAVRSVTIEDDVMLALNVFISDCTHGYTHVDEPYKYQPLWRIAPVIIKRGCWIGQNVVIMPGVTIGEMAIIGANSVVTNSVPSRCIAIGSPAHVIKRWDEARGDWLDVSASTTPNNIDLQTILPGYFHS